MQIYKTNMPKQSKTKKQNLWTLTLFQGRLTWQIRITWCIKDIKDYAFDFTYPEREFNRDDCYKLIEDLKHMHCAGPANI